MLVAQAVAYNNEEFVRRKFRVMNLLAEVFDEADWLLLHSPFVYAAGITKSIVACDVSVACVFFFQIARRAPSQLNVHTPHCYTTIADAVRRLRGGELHSPGLRAAAPAQRGGGRGGVGGRRGREVSLCVEFLYQY